MSKYLPIENIIYRTKLSKEEVIRRLTDNIEAVELYSFGVRNPTYSKPYFGKIGSNNFQIIRAIKYRNSFLPEIKGEIYSEFDGTKIKVNMKPHSLVLVIMAFWLGGVFIGCIVTTYAMFTTEFTPFHLIPFGMLIFGIALVFSGFKTESSASKKDLLRILEAEIEENNQN
jgi:hypothetical protein